MKKFLFLLLLISSVAYPQIKLSDNAEISVITCGPYQHELYSAFGHSAFRVYDPQHNIDEAYNYGVFDFDQPNFYLNFARGYLYYKLGLYDYKRFEYYYIYHNRSVHEQKLNLSQSQKQKLYDYLQWNAKPENQFYRYDYFYDNCATKIRDVVVNVFGDSVKFDGAYINTTYTIRELTDLYLKDQPWGDLGIDICLGLPMDKTAAPYEYMFLPDYIETGFDHANIKDSVNTKPIVREKIRHYESQPEAKPSFNFFHPLLIFSLFALLTLYISYRDLKRKKLALFFDSFFFTILGMIGLLLLTLWVATDHRAAAKNFNLLWALPTHLIAVIAFIRQPKWLEQYFFAVLILTSLLLISWPFLPQKLHYALVPLAMSIVIRSYTQYTIRKNSGNYK